MSARTRLPELDRASRAGKLGQPRQTAAGAAEVLGSAGVHDDTASIFPKEGCLTMTTTVTTVVTSRITAPSNTRLTMRIVSGPPASSSTAFGGDPTSGCLKLCAFVRYSRRHDAVPEMLS